MAEGEAVVAARVGTVIENLALPYLQLDPAPNILNCDIINQGTTWPRVFQHTAAFAIANGWFHE